MIFNKCSYCQREFGTISKKGKQIYKTYDHIQSKYSQNKINNHRGGINRKFTFSEIENMLDCCNQCNVLKGNLSLNNFYSKLDYFYRNKSKNRGARYLTKNIVYIIRNSIRVLKDKNIIKEPVLINIITY